MYANTCWGLLGFAVTFGVAVLGLPTQYEWLTPWFLAAAVMCGVGSVICFGWPLRQKENRDKLKELSTHPARLAKLIEPSHMIIFGLVIALGGVVWQIPKDQFIQQAAQLQFWLARTNQCVEILISAI
jgi:hypothetical protein